MIYLHFHDRYGSAYIRLRQKDAWEETKHPRGQPKNAGQFVKGGGGSTRTIKPLSTLGKTKVPTLEAQRASLKELSGYISLIAELQKGPPGFITPSKFILDNSKEFIFDDLTYSGKRGKPQACYMNAGQLALNDPTKTYVEGYVVVHGVPIEHAWVVDQKGKVQDPTITGPQGIGGYAGVPIKREYLQDAIMRSRYWGLFGHNSADYGKWNSKIVQPGIGGARLSKASPKSLPPTSASRLLENYQSKTNVSSESLLADMPREVGQAVRQAEKNLSTGVPTNAKVSEGGFKNLDGSYTPERQKLHDEIIEKIFTAKAIKRATPKAGEKPTFTLIGGRAGSGKGYFTQSGIVGDNALIVDNDAIKAMIPEYRGWNAALVHEEASDIFERVDRIGRKLGINIVHDATMKTYESAARRVDAYKSSGYAVKGLYMFCPPVEAAKRALSRFVQGTQNAAEGHTGRYVSPSYVLNSSSNEASFDALRDSFDDWSVYKSIDTKKPYTPELVMKKD